VFPVRYELGFYIPEDDILHSHRRENLKSYIRLWFYGYEVAWLVVSSQENGINDRRYPTR
jgi:hypothetical protein